MNHYEEKQARKLERYTELAERRERESQASFKRAHDIGDAIPFGQPILVGHHSEKRHRRDLERIDNSIRKGIELGKIAEHYENKAKNIVNPYAISSDDPEAVTKLKEKLSKIEEEIKAVKEHNKKCKVIHLALYGFENGTHVSNNNGSYQTYAVVEDKHVCPCGFCPQIEWKMKRVPKEIKPIIENYAKTGILEQPELKEENKKIESWVLQNLNGNKARILKRIEELRNLAKVEEIEETVNNITLSIDKEENRIKLSFPGKPTAEIISKLKHSGFHWSPFNKVWQRMISDYALQLARDIQKEAMKQC